MINHTKVDESELERLIDTYPDNLTLKCIKYRQEGKSNDQISKLIKKSKSAVQKYLKAYVDGGEKVENILGIKEYAKFIVRRYKSPLFLDLPYLNWSDGILHQYLVEEGYNISRRTCSDVISNTDGLCNVENVQEVFFEVKDYIYEKNQIFFADYMALGTISSTAKLTLFPKVGKWLLLMYRREEESEDVTQDENISYIEITASKRNYNKQEGYSRKEYGGVQDPFIKEICAAIRKRVGELSMDDKPVMLILTDNPMNKYIRKEIHADYKKSIQVLLIQNIERWCELDPDEYGTYIDQYKDKIKKYIWENKGKDNILNIKDIKKNITAKDIK